MSDPEKPWQFKKGWKGGPGRKKGSKIMSKSLREILNSDEVKLEMTHTTPSGRKKVQKYDLKVDKNITYALSAALIREALKGNVTATREIIDRVEGKPIQAIDYTDTKSQGLEKLSKEELEKLSKEIVQKLSQGDEQRRTD